MSDKGSPSQRQPLDDLTSAAMAVATVIALNKPIYPLYVWWLAPDALKASFWTLVSFPFYAVLPFSARRHAFAARLALILVGTIDTFLINATLGDGAGAWLFLLACLMLATMSFNADELWTKRIAIGCVFLIFAASFSRFPIGLAGPLSAETSDTLFKLNAFGAASLIAFTGLRFPAALGGRRS